MWKWINSYAKPDKAYELCNQLLPWFLVLMFVAFPVGMLWGLAFAPTDYQQFDVYRIIYIHVPSATQSMTTYIAMAVAAFVGVVWQWRTALTTMIAIAPVGAVITFISLFTGAVWGQPTWGTWWIWDARLTSQLILLFLYLGVIALYVSFDDKQQGGKAAAIMAMVGVINIPIIKYSVEWWNTLHQPASISKIDKPSMPPDMAIPLVISIFGMIGFIGAIVIIRLKYELIKRDAHRPWVAELLGDAGHKLHRIPGRTIALVSGLILFIAGVFYAAQQGFKFDDMAAFWNMGNRGFYVWLSFGVSLLAMVLLAAQSLYMSKAVKTYVSTQQARAQRIIAARAKRKQKNIESTQGSKA
ncbi:heme exporter protein CcmD [Glaciecola sp. XM2]|jgi:heme exporter protein C|nr:heme exporter protein CcmD [Glaciecola sp. XM2]